MRRPAYLVLHVLFLTESAHVRKPLPRRCRVDGSHYSEGGR